MKTITIKEEFADDCITRVAGERLRHMILDLTKNGANIEIDFTDTVIASTSFFDEGFAKLTEHGWNKDMLLSRITLNNINPNDKKILWQLISHRLSS